MLIVKCFKVPRTEKFILIFPYNVELLDKIKSYPKEEREYDVNNKQWIVRTYSLYLLMKSYGKSDIIKFDFGDQKEIFQKSLTKVLDKINKDIRELNKIIEDKKEWLEFKISIEDNYLDYYDILHKNLKIGTKLMNHQMPAILYINKIRNILVSHDMGLGKTISSIAYVEMNDFNKVFVITPNSLKFNFYGEIEKFTNSKAHIIGWRNNKYTISESKYIITNYEYFNSNNKVKGSANKSKRNYEKIETKIKNLNIGKIDVLICDECQTIKSSDSQTYENFNHIFTDNIFTNNKPSKVFLSGTPAPNRAHELYNVLNQISPIDFRTKTYFYQYYCGMTYKVDGFGYDVDVEGTKFEELYHKIAPYVHRKRKIDVLNLPPKSYQRILIEMSDKEEKEYARIASCVIQEIDGSKKYMDILTSLIKLRQYTAKVKAKSIIEIIDNIINCGQKVVIVDFFKEALIELKAHYGDIAVLHTGDEKNLEIRAKMVADFQDKNSDIKIFLGSIQTCNYGLTLTAACYMIQLTQSYSPGQNDQVADRIFRIGQENPVTIYNGIIKETIDEYVFDVVENKRKEVIKVVDNLDYETTIDESIVSDIISKLRKNLNNN